MEAFYMFYRTIFMKKRKNILFIRNQSLRVVTNRVICSMINNGNRLVYITSLPTQNGLFMWLTGLVNWLTSLVNRLSAVVNRLTGLVNRLSSLVNRLTRLVKD